MAGKYVGVIDKLPRLLTTEEPAHQDKVDALKATLRQTDIASSAVNLAEAYMEWRAKRDALKEELETINLHVEAISQMLCSSYEDEGVTSLKLASGFSISVQVEPYAIVKDREALRLWAIANGLERSLTLPWQTTNGIAKERLLSGEPEPDGVETYAKNKIVQRKA